MAISTEFKAALSATAREDGFVIDGQAFTNFATLAIDGARRRPRYFDGRFLTGKDLSADQDYVRQRQDDLARASGTGVIAGLDIRQESATELTIGEGTGITISGDLVVIAKPLKVSVADLAMIQALDASFGIRMDAAASSHKRTGLFLLSLRAVEFTANPIDAFPTTITGQRRMEHGDIIEATAITLIPYPSSSNPLDMRATAARQIFLEASGRGLPSEALPIAMLALNQGAIQWIDVNMVRRENRTVSSLQATLGGRPRALAEAHVLQYQEQLQEVLSGGATAFPAASVFSVLPPVGQMPLACLTHDGFGFKESFFPPGLSVDVSFIPTDEIAALVEESLSLAPIDLSAPPADLAGTGVVILIPLPRADVKAAIDALSGTEINDTAIIPQPRFWMDNLRALNLITDVTRPKTDDPQAAAWQKYRSFAEKQEHGLVWFARRRNVALRSSLEGVAQSASEISKIDSMQGFAALLAGKPPPTEPTVKPSASQPESAVIKNPEPKPAPEASSDPAPTKPKPPAKDPPVKEPILTQPPVTEPAVPPVTEQPRKPPIEPPPIKPTRPFQPPQDIFVQPGLQPGLQDVLQPSPPDFGMNPRVRIDPTMRGARPIVITPNQ